MIRAVNAVSLLALLLVATGCAEAPGDWRGAEGIAEIRGTRLQPAERSRPDRARVIAAIDSAAAQIRRCYRHPGVPSVGRSIATRLRIHLSPDGSLSDVPAVIGQSGVTDTNRAFAARMAEAASQAVLRCAPLRLPPDLYTGGWDEIDLTFSPAMLV
ncbi:MAG: hypothetical protein JWP15_3414 [Alphaproteobacteria bacterium]|nr:hypothetical protein [Alphaproteobacteria bacterium]